MKLNEITELKVGDLEQVQTYTSGDLYIADQNLTSLEGCPKEVTGDFGCNRNNLTSFEYFPKIIKGYCYISGNKFTSFKDIDQHIEYIGGMLSARSMTFTSGFSDLFGIDGLMIIEINNHRMQEIVNEYLPTKDLIEFQDEMIKAGYESYL